jgi:Leucine-rich repeat (LRR) protein
VRPFHCFLFIAPLDWLGETTRAKKSRDFFQQRPMQAPIILVDGPEIMCDDLLRAIISAIVPHGFLQTREQLQDLYRTRALCLTAQTHVDETVVPSVWYIHATVLAFSLPPQLRGKFQGITTFPFFEPKSFAGLGNPVNMRHLQTFCPQMTDPYLSRFSGLLSLDLGYRCAKVSDRSVSLLTNLQHVGLAYNNKITAVGSLQHLRALTSLSLMGETLIDDDAIVLLADRLSRLKLSKNSAITSQGLSKLTRLTSLNLCSTGLHHDIDDSGLTGLTGLTRLNLYGNHIITDRGISSLTGLTNLHLQHTDWVTGHALRRLPALTKLTLSGCAVTIPGVEIGQLTQLRVLDIEAHAGFDDAVLQRLTGLTKLTIGNEIYVTARAINSMTALKSVVLGFGARVTKEALLLEGGRYAHYWYKMSRYGPQGRLEYRLERSAVK